MQNPTINFNSNADLNNWILQFQDKADEICKKLGIVSHSEIIKIRKDENHLEVSITTIGTFIKGSNKETAISRIYDEFSK